MVRRIYNQYPHLVNPNFEIDEQILKGNKEIDSIYEGLNDQSELKPFTTRNKYYAGCFNRRVSSHYKWECFNNTIGIYDNYF